MNYTKIILLLASFALILPLSAQAEMFPPNVDRPSFDKGYSRSNRARTRQERGEETLSKGDRQRQAVEEYMDEAKRTNSRPKRVRRSRSRSDRNHRESRRITSSYKRNVKRSQLPSDREYLRQTPKKRKRRKYRRPSRNMKKRPSSNDTYNDYWSKRQKQQKRGSNNYNVTRDPFSDRSPQSSFEPTPANDSLSYLSPKSGESRGFGDDENNTWSDNASSQNYGNNSSLYESNGVTKRYNRFADPFADTKSSRSALLNMKTWARNYNSKNLSSKVEKDPSTFDDNYKNGFGLKIGILGGMSQATNSNDTIQTQREEEQTAQNFYLGLISDLTVGRYFGAELDVYLGIASPVTLVEESDDDDTPSAETTKSFHQSGTMFNLKGQVPIYTGNFKLVPKIGLGYGSLSLTQEESTAGAQQTISNSVKGFFLSGGIEVLPTPSLILSLDYASSLGASSDITTDAGNFQSAGTGFDSFNRLRVGAQIKVSSHILIGAQFIQRTMVTEPPATGGGPMGAVGTGDSGPEINAESMSQVLGVLMYEF